MQEWFGEGIRLPLGNMTVMAPQNYKAFFEYALWRFYGVSADACEKNRHIVKKQAVCFDKK